MTDPRVHCDCTDAHQNADSDEKFAITNDGELVCKWCGKPPVVNR